MVIREYPSESRKTNFVVTIFLFEIQFGFYFIHAVYKVARRDLVRSFLF